MLAIRPVFQASVRRILNIVLSIYLSSTRTDFPECLLRSRGDRDLVVWMGIMEILLIHDFRPQSAQIYRRVGTLHVTTAAPGHEKYVEARFCRASWYKASPALT